LILAASVATPAPAAFPGVPGPIVYPRELITGEVLGGLVLHGPRQSQPPHRLTSNGGDDSPSFSADGKLIAFEGNRDPGPASIGTHIYVVKPDGTGLKQVTSGATFDRDPSFSPDGRRLVFDRRLSGKTYIFSVNVDGSGLRQLTKGNGHDSEPVYTPNGRRIVFASDRDRDAGTDRSDIFAMAPSGADMRVLIDGPYKEEEPDTSPDGRSIAFVSNRQPGINIYVADADGRHVRQLTHNRRNCSSGNCNLSPSWAPDGKHIAFLSVGRFSSDLEVMRSDGTQTKEFANGSTEEEGLGTTIGAPAWGAR
jgi:Tol biopolymer transport system component